MVASAAASVSAYLQYACGHAALVTLPRVKGEGARQREERIALEKSTALSRQCDFCAPQSATVEAHLPEFADGVAVDQHDQENNVVTVSDTASAPSAESSTEGKDGRSPLRRLSDEQEKELTRLYSETDTPVPEIA